MDKDQMIKWVLIAAAAYVIYRYVLKGQLFGGSAPMPRESTVTPGVVTPGTRPTTPGTRPTTPVTQPAQPPQLPVQPNEGMLVFAALGEPSAVSVVRAAGTKLTSDQWNYYRSRGGGDVPTIDLFPEGNRGYLMDIDYYLAARTLVVEHPATGMGQMTDESALAQMAAVNPWIT